VIESGVLELPIVAGNYWKFMVDSAIMSTARSTHPQPQQDEAAELLREAASLAAAGEVTAAIEVQQRAQALLAELATVRASRRRRASTLPSAEPAQSARQMTIAALNEIGVPASPRDIAEYARVRFDTSLDQRVFASLRRDERRTWDSPRSHRPVYIAPALSMVAPRRLLPMRGKLALSDWPLERRLIGPWSERVDHLTATLNLARRLAWLRAHKPAEAERLAGLVARYAMTVPDALEGEMAPDPDRIEAATGAELEVLGPEDTEWRAEAAACARELLTPEEQLWGAELPTLVERTR